jgi:outer membrane murein-binding lipoprotein Lpp
MKAHKKVYIHNLGKAERRGDQMKILKLLLFATISCVFLLVGCASKEVAPTVDISKAEMAIKAAMDRDASTNAPLELKTAQDKLQAAEEAMKQEKFEKARRLAEEAEVDAKVAESKSDAVKEQKHAEEMRNSISTLRQEIERAQQSGK